MVRGCCRAMHTTKKKRKYGKKRSATEASIDETNNATAEESADGDDTAMMGVDTPLENRHELDNPNIDATLQDMQPSNLPSIHMHLFNGDLQNSFLQHNSLPVVSSPQESQHGIPTSSQTQSAGQMSHEAGGSLQLVQTEIQNHDR